MIEIFNDEQGSPEWFERRRGIVTGSRFQDVLAKGEGKTRRRYMMDLAAEILTGEVAPSYTNGHMERGNEQEPEARRMYALMTDTEPQQVGFIRNGAKGCSPDSLLGEDSGLEIKTALGAIQIERLLRGTLPAEHRAQVQGSMWVTERPHWTFVSYSPGLPLLIVPVERDDAYIDELDKAVQAFNSELAEVVATIRAYGGASTLRDQLRESVG